MPAPLCAAQGTVLQMVAAWFRSGPDGTAAAARSIAGCHGSPKHGACEHIVDKNGEQAYHCRDQIQGPHADTDVGVVDATHDHILVFSHKIRMCRHNLDQCEQCNVFHCVIMIEPTSTADAKIDVQFWSSSWRKLASFVTHVLASAFPDKPCSMPPMIQVCTHS